MVTATVWSVVGVRLPDPSAIDPLDIEPVDLAVLDPEVMDEAGAMADRDAVPLDVVPADRAAGRLVVVIVPLAGAIEPEAEEEGASTVLEEPFMAPLAGAILPLDGAIAPEVLPESAGAIVEAPDPLSDADMAEPVVAAAGSSAGRLQAATDSAAIPAAAIKRVFMVLLPGNDRSDPGGPPFFGSHDRVSG